MTKQKTKLNKTKLNKTIKKAVSCISNNVGTCLTRYTVLQLLLYIGRFRNVGNGHWIKKKEGIKT